MRKLLIAVGLVALAWATTTFADEPPDDLMFHIVQQRLVHDQTCTIGNRRGVECLVFQEGEALWVVLFDDKLTITHVFHMENDQLRPVWIRKGVEV